MGCPVVELQCKYYSNPVRMTNALQYLSTQPGFRFFAVSGVVARDKKNFKVITETATLVVACVISSTKKNSMMLMTSDLSFREKDGEMIDTAVLSHDTIFYNLCLLLQEKFNTTHNACTIEFKGDKVIVSVSISDSDGGTLQCTVRGSEGELKVCGPQNIRDMLNRCHQFYQFRYVYQSADGVREVSVRMSRSEILKDVARYLNRTLVLVSFTADGTVLEQYIGDSSMLEVTTLPDGTRVYKKVGGSMLRDARSFCVYQTSATVEDVLKEQGRVLSKKKKG